MRKFIFKNIKKNLYYFLATNPSCTIDDIIKSDIVFSGEGNFIYDELIKTGRTGENRIYRGHFSYGSASYGKDINRFKYDTEVQKIISELDYAFKLRKEDTQYFCSDDRLIVPSLES